MAGNFTTQVESHYKIEGPDDNKSSDVLDQTVSDIQTLEKRETTPINTHGKKTPEGYANIIIINKDSIQSKESMERIEKMDEAKTKKDKIAFDDQGANLKRAN